MWGGAPAPRRRVPRRQPGVPEVPPRSWISALLNSGGQGAAERGGIQSLARDCIPADVAALTKNEQATKVSVGILERLIREPSCRCFPEARAQLLHDRAGRFGRRF